MFPSLNHRRTSKLKHVQRKPADDMTKRAALSKIDLSSVDPEMPLRLDVAAQLAYPDGSMTKSGLRREIGRGRLECERTAGKQYVTLAGIQRMRVLCRENSNAVNAVAAKLSTSDRDLNVDVARQTELT
jgi:hypothetical protein